MTLATKRVRVGVFGGAFDPPHLGHLVLLHALLTSSLVDKIWIIPSGTRSDKTCRGTPQQRYEWTSLFVKEMLPALPEQKEIIVSDIEIREPQDLEGAVELFSLLRTTSPDYDFFLAIGTDLVATLPQWRHAERLKTEVQFLVVARDETLHLQQLDFSLTHLKTYFKSHISSSLIKELGDSGISCAGLLSPLVYRSLREQGFFKGR